MLEVAKGQEILVCLDLEKGSDYLAQYVADAASKQTKPVHALYVAPTRSRNSGDESLRQQLRNIVATNMTAIQSITIAIRRGHVDEEIVRYADEHSIGVIAIGHRHNVKHRLHRVSTTHAVLRSAKVPVVVVPLNNGGS